MNIRFWPLELVVVGSDWVVGAAYLVFEWVLIGFRVEPILFSRGF